MRFTLATAAALAVAGTPAAATDGWVKETQRVAPGQVFIMCKNAALGVQMAPGFHYAQYNIETEVTGELSPEQRDMTLRFRAKKTAAGALLYRVDLEWPDTETFLGGADIYNLRASVDGRLAASDGDEVEWYEWAPKDEAQWLRAVGSGRRARFEFLGTGDKVLGAREIDLTPIRRAMNAAEAANWTC